MIIALSHWFVLCLQNSLKTSNNVEILNNLSYFFRFLGTDPVKIDASNYSPQKRNRLYWSNIPGLQQIPEEAMSGYHSLQTVLTPNCQRMATSFFSQTITTNPVTTNQGTSIMLLFYKLS